MTQVKWHPYPKEKPTKDGFYLVTFVEEDDSKDVGLDNYRDFGFVIYDEITAWAELPDPYDSEGDVDETE